jgi:hypothetical protein
MKNSFRFLLWIKEIAAFVIRVCNCNNELGSTNLHDPGRTMDRHVLAFHIVS